jgi:hypothetical protein
VTDNQLTNHRCQHRLRFPRILSFHMRLLLLLTASFFFFGLAVCTVIDADNEMIRCRCTYITLTVPPEITREICTAVKLLVSVHCLKWPTFCMHYLKGVRCPHALRLFYSRNAEIIFFISTVSITHLYDFDLEYSEYLSVPVKYM